MRQKARFPPRQTRTHFILNKVRVEARSAHVCTPRWITNHDGNVLNVCRSPSPPQLMLEAQNRRIDDLLERIRLQQEKLDKQNVRIRTLQSQVGGTV